MWTFTDRVLAAAQVLSEDMRCPGCGQPKHEAWNPDSAGWYAPREATCEGCAVLERQAASDKKPHPERKRWVVDERPADVELMAWQPGPVG